MRWNIWLRYVGIALVATGAGLAIGRWYWPRAPLYILNATYNPLPLLDVTVDPTTDDVDITFSTPQSGYCLVDEKNGIP